LSTTLLPKVFLEEAIPNFGRSSLFYVEILPIFSHATDKMIFKCKELLSANYLALFGEASTRLLRDSEAIETPQCEREEAR
jgi:hypothetical protein